MHGSHKSRAEKKKTTQRRTSLKTQQADQWGTVEQAYRDGRKDERVQNMIDAHGVAWCESCETEFKPREAHSKLDYAHDKRRSQAQGYRPRKGAQNDAHFRLLCRSCHRAFDKSEVSFSK